MCKFTLCVQLYAARKCVVLALKVRTVVCSVCALSQDQTRLGAKCGRLHFVKKAHLREKLQVMDPGRPMGIPWL